VIGLRLDIDQQANHVRVLTGFGKLWSIPHSISIVDSAGRKLQQGPNGFPAFDVTAGFTVTADSSLWLPPPFRPSPAVVRVPPGSWIYASNLYGSLGEKITIDRAAPNGLAVAALTFENLKSAVADPGSSTLLVARHSDTDHSHFWTDFSQDLLDATTVQAHFGLVLAGLPAPKAYLSKVRVSVDAFNVPGGWQPRILPLAATGSPDETVWWSYDVAASEVTLEANNSVSSAEFDYEDVFHRANQDPTVLANAAATFAPADVNCARFVVMGVPGPRIIPPRTSRFRRPLLLSSPPAAPACVREANVCFPLPNPGSIPSGPPPVTTAYGRVDVLHPTGHKGVDIHAASGTNILAPMDGTAVFRTSATAGNYVTLTGACGEKMIFMHLLSSPITPGGQTNVHRGQLIGQVGSTGLSTSAHLHFEIRGSNGTPEDPLGPLNRPRMNFGRCYPTGPCPDIPGKTNVGRLQLAAKVPLGSGQMQRAVCCDCAGTQDYCPNDLCVNRVLGPWVDSSTGNEIPRWEWPPTGPADPNP
jgi:murein DD-endopeptidase MepM/ murein hydrolase activator NlpD